MTDAEPYNPLADLLTITEAGTALGLADNSVYRLIGAGKLAALRHGGKSWIEREEITDYFARQRAEAAKVRERRAKAARAGGRPQPLRRLPVGSTELDEVSSA